MNLLPDCVETERLTLRRWRQRDAEALGAAVGSSVEHLRPWMAWIQYEPLPLDERVQLIEGWTEEWERGGDAVFGALARDGGDVIGGTGLHRRSGPEVLEIGYWIAEAHTKRGYATEIAAALTSAAFEQPGIERVEIHHDKANAISGRVPTRLGYTMLAERHKEIAAPGELGIDCCWSIDRHDWHPTR